jgi:enoyl-CoA hydratase/carnithine racemase
VTTTDETVLPPGLPADLSTIRLSSPEPGIVVLTLDRPERLNALSADLLRELHAVLDALAADPSVRVLVLTGAGRGFCAGLDLTAFDMGGPDRAVRSPQTGLALQKHIAALVPKLRALPQVVISAVNGPAAGGGLALALASDVRIGAASSRYNVAFVRLGLSGCDIGVSWLLPRLIGASRAFELLLTGRIVDATEADRIGLVTRVVPDGELHEHARELAAQLAAGAPLALAASKRLLWDGVGRSVEAALPDEARTVSELSGTADAREGLAAVIERRPPVFTGR